MQKVILTFTPDDDDDGQISIQFFSCPVAPAEVVWVLKWSEDNLMTHCASVHVTCVPLYHCNMKPIQSNKYIIVFKNYLKQELFNTSF